MYGAEDPSIAGMVLDSPFSDLVDLMMELVDTYKFRLPKFTVSRFSHGSFYAILQFETTISCFHFIEIYSLSSKQML